MLSYGVHRNAKKNRTAKMSDMQEPYEDYAAGVFQGLVLSLSGGSPQAKKEMIDLVKQQGGSYLAELTRECTHLVIMQKDSRARVVSAKER